MLGQNITEDTSRYNGRFAIPYMRTKAKAEQVIEESLIPFTMLRLPAVFGKGDTYVSPVIADFMRKNNFHLYGDGNKLISLMYVKNLGSLIENIIMK
jgi:nucleoside-diphosphate-sugar epimerase